MNLLLLMVLHLPLAQFKTLSRCKTSSKSPVVTCLLFYLLLGLPLASLILGKLNNILVGDLAMVAIPLVNHDLISLCTTYSYSTLNSVGPLHF